jgi:glycosyltransferase involved in cell wall biosynthesis
MPQSLSIFFPAYDDAATLTSLIETAFSTAEALTTDFEVIVVNDGSRDETPALLREMNRHYGPQLRVVTHPVNRGYGGALRSGFESCTKDLIFYTDGDGQYDIGELPKLWNKLTPGVGFVNGYKLERADGFHRRIIGDVYRTSVRFVFRLKIRDVDCDFRLIRRSLLAPVRLTSGSGSVCVELTKVLESSGWDFAEVGVHHYPRVQGRSKFFRLAPLLATFRELAGLFMKGVWTGKLIR